ncbi:MAG: ATP-grasp domain-containing protein [Candidatus Eisenbacteria bacterium]|uniref:ATP-grasp domain-containing protein n=1 Tax=Eiseniibacteriota bacterium TaxID=2212470 RepID=A0A538T6E4_UNCEI|nr:MAG: ATP-grasp domain-containing protein [Candidatus Eisenbacteria bacterium]
MSPARADFATRGREAGERERAFRKVLVANRGEIAVRVCRTLKEMGIPSATVYSDADRGAPHARSGDESVAIGPAPPAQSYLNAQAILEAARRAGADAIHPGYGFLSESATFAGQCRDAGLVFIGPSPESMARLGDKAAARRTAAECGVPCVPGAEGIDSVERALAAAERVGYPVLLKASGGGGGRGMRLVQARDEMPAALEAARREAKSAFGDGRLLLEKYIHPARHIEIQVLADGRQVVPLGERECSLQRRHQKLIEESPSVAVTPEIRDAMQRAAASLARAASYAGAMTVEFLMGADGAFYFLEVNTRLQVEHTVTEMRSGLDLVRAQVLIAAGRPVGESLGGPEPELRGHAIEARLCAEDPYHGWLPQTGRILLLAWPDVEGLRVDSGIAEGQTLHPYYDSLLAKVVAHGRDREDARAKLLLALRGTALLGVITNQSFLIDLLEDAAFRRGETSTDTVESREWQAPKEIPDAALVAAAAFLAAPRVARGGGEEETDRYSPWRRLGAWGRTP